MSIRRPLFLLAAISLLAGCGGHKPAKMSLEVPMTDRVTEPLKKALSVVPANPNLKLFIAEVKDERADKSKIGENKEEDDLGARPVTASGAAPAEFVRGVFTGELTGIGMAPIGNAADANRILTFSLSQFFVVETGTYKADVAGLMTVTDASGKVLFSGSVHGDNSTFGRSFSEENYQQVLSNATTEVLENLLKNPAFAAAINVP